MDGATSEKTATHEPLLYLRNFEPWDLPLSCSAAVDPSLTRRSRSGSKCCQRFQLASMAAGLAGWMLQMSGCQNRQWESTKSHDSWGTRFLDVKNLLALDFYFAAWFLVKCSLGIPMKGAVSNQHSLLARSQLRSADSLAEFSEFSGAQSRPSVAMKGHEESRQGPVEPSVFGCWGFIPQRCISPTVQNRVK